MRNTAALWPRNWPHEMPEKALSIIEAHQAMQLHRNCRKEECARKRAAWDVLVESRRIVPDSGRVR